MYFFYLPIFYFLIIHARTKTRAFSWIFIFLVPVGILSYLALSPQFDFLYFFILTIMLYNVYEIGYVYNDCETTKKEVSPTYRLSEEQLVYYENYRLFIYSARCIITFLLLSTIYFVYDKPLFTVAFMLAECLVLSLVYYWYNSTRSRLNIVIGTILGTLRYSFVPVAMYFSLYNVVSFDLILISFLIFPLINILTFLTKKKFKIYWAISIFVHHDKWRVIYYSILCFLFVLMGFLDKQVVSVLTNFDIIMLLLYYLTLRSAYLLVLSNDNFISRSVKYARRLQYFNRERNNGD